MDVYESESAVKSQRDADSVADKGHECVKTHRSFTGKYPHFHQSHSNEHHAEHIPEGMVKQSRLEHRIDWRKRPEYAGVAGKNFFGFLFNFFGGRFHFLHYAC